VGVLARLGYEEQAVGQVPENWEIRSNIWILLCISNICNPISLLSHELVSRKSKIFDVCRRYGFHIFK
jgi:hypothetical protein